MEGLCFKRTGCEAVDWISDAGKRGNKHSGSIKGNFLTRCETIILSRKTAPCRQL
jgi:hypothetical protein